MRGETSWVRHSLENLTKDINDFDSLTKLNSDKGKKEDLTISLDMMPDDLLERILACLPIASIFRAGCVCKRWNEMVTSEKFLWTFSKVSSLKPWYFMFTSSDEPGGYAYDPTVRKWYSIDLPCIETSSWFVASSGGLVCFMDNDNRSELYVCNPITKCWRKLLEPPTLGLSDYSALAMSANRKSGEYNISVVKSNQVEGNFVQWKISIHIYDSGKMTWATPLDEVTTGWRSGDVSVISGGILYFLIYSTSGGNAEVRHRLIAYDLSARSSVFSLAGNSISMPRFLTCGRLMNLREKLVMVGGIGKPDRPDIIKGIGIWILKGKEWQEVARMPHKFFQGFGEFDDVFASGGTDDLVYIQSYGSPALLVFDICQKQWKWAQRCPVAKRFPLQLFTGFCFEPRLEIAP